MSKTVQTSIVDGVATLLLNRPDRLNALDAEMARELAIATRALAENPEVRCVVVTGAGDNFQAGGDIEYFRAGLQGSETTRREEIRAIIDEVHTAITHLRTMPKPVVARIQGAAAGFGVSLLAACDLAIAADSARFTLAYCHIGASPDGGSTYALPRMVGMKRAMELALLGERFDAAKAEAIGLINRAVPAALLDATVQKLAQHFASGPTFAYGRTKALLNASWNNDMATQLDAEMESFSECALSNDFTEGVIAFCDKRKAEFTGR